MIVSQRRPVNPVKQEQLNDELASVQVALFKQGCR